MISMTIPISQTAFPIAIQICMGLALAVWVTRGNTLFTALSIAVIPLLIPGFGKYAIPCGIFTLLMDIKHHLFTV